MKKKLLLHICCAPCSASAVKRLQNDFAISFYWYNPNIYDKEEYEKRKNTAAEYAKNLNILFFEERFEYDYDKWRAASLESCELCYKIRLDKAAAFAKKESFDCFSTSLLSSPYQKHGLVKKIGEESGKNSGAEFLYMDFRPDFYEGKNSLRKAGYYIQKYCGCAKSYNERFKSEEK